jgi:hypothetical protein
MITSNFHCQIEGIIDHIALFEITEFSFISFISNAKPDTAITEEARQMAGIYEIELGKAMSSWIVIHDFLNENGNITKNIIETKTKNYVYDDLMCGSTTKRV